MARPNPNQMHDLKHKLVAERKVLLDATRQELARWGEHPMGELAGEVPDVGDESVATAVTALDHAVVQRHIAAIRNIDDALTQMRKHHYGICVDCGDEIAYARLAAFPTASRCIGCQEHHERIYAHEATPTL
jgi:RNA polymerase-binding protein DksA